MTNNDNKKDTQKSNPSQLEVNDLKIMNDGAIIPIRKYVNRISQLLTVFCLIMLVSLSIRLFGKNGLSMDNIMSINDMSIMISLFIIFLIVSIVKRLKILLNKFDYTKDKKVSQQGYVRKLMNMFQKISKCLFPEHARLLGADFLTRRSFRIGELCFIYHVQIMQFNSSMRKHLLRCILLRWISQNK